MASHRDRVASAMVAMFQEAFPNLSKNISERISEFGKAVKTKPDGRSVPFRLLVNSEKGSWKYLTHRTHLKNGNTKLQPVI